MISDAHRRVNTGARTKIAVRPRDCNRAWRTGPQATVPASGPIGVARRLM